MEREHSFDKVISERIIEVIDESFAAQSEIAVELGISKSSVNSIMRGASLPNLASLYLLCNYLNIDTDYVLNITDEKPNIERKHDGRIYGVRPQTNNAISGRLSDAITQSKYQRKEIAEAIGVDPVNISAYVSGACQPSLETLGKLCAFLDVSADDILGVKFYKLFCEDNVVYVDIKKEEYRLKRDNITKKIMENIRRIISNGNVSYRKVATEIDIQPLMISKYMNGKAVPSPTTIQKICKFYKISSKEIFDIDID